MWLSQHVHRVNGLATDVTFAWLNVTIAMHQQSTRLSASPAGILCFFSPRTKDLIEVVIQLNETKGFLAVTTFHTDRLQVYPSIFVDPAQVQL